MNTNLGYYVKRFLSYYLNSVRNLSNNTIYSYRDTIKLFLEYNVKENNTDLTKATLELLNKNNILKFLDYLENNKKDSINTRNQRLACLKSFCRFILDEDSLALEYVQDIFSIKKKKCVYKEIDYLTKEQVQSILSKPNLTNKQGMKELVILTLLYDAGLRVSELINLKVKDVNTNATIARLRILNTKGNKSREVPITDNSKKILEQYIKKLNEDSNSYLVCSNRKEKYSSNGIRKIINKYTSDIPFKVTPHTFRHTKASHLVETNTPIIYIRDFLGHESIDTTMIYAKISSKVKNETIINNSLDLNNKIKYDLNNGDLLEWLNNL